MGNVLTQTSFLWCFLIGFAACSLLMAVGMFVSRKSDASGKLLYLFSFNNFNVGNFAIPFLTGLISANGFAAICLFDISVVVFLYGVDYSAAEGIRRALLCSPGIFRGSFRIFS